eukprot:UN31647
MYVFVDCSCLLIWPYIWQKTLSNMKFGKGYDTEIGTPFGGGWRYLPDEYLRVVPSDVADIRINPETVVLVPNGLSSVPMQLSIDEWAFEDLSCDIQEIKGVKFEPPEIIIKRGQRTTNKFTIQISTPNISLGVHDIFISIPKLRIKQNMKRAIIIDAGVNNIYFKQKEFLVIHGDKIETELLCDNIIQETIKI